MFRLIILLALGWLLYKALFPEVAPYYGKDLPDDTPRLRYRSPRLYEGYDFISPDPLLENLEDIFTDPCHPGYVGDDYELDQGYLVLKRRYEIEDNWIDQESMRLLEEERLRFEDDQRMMFEDSFARDESFQLDEHYHHYDICTGENDLSTGFGDW